MGAYGFMMDAIQSGYIAELNDKNKTQQEEIVELKTKVLNLEKWVVYLNSRLDALQSKPSDTKVDYEDNSGGQS